MALVLVCDACGAPALAADRVELAWKTVVVPGLEGRPAVSVTVGVVVVAPQALCGPCQQRALEVYRPARYGVPS